MSALHNSKEGLLDIQAVHEAQHRRFQIYSTGYSCSAYDDIYIHTDYHMVNQRGLTKSTCEGIGGAGDGAAPVQPYPAGQG